MRYEIHTTKQFDYWFRSIKDFQSRARILTRMDQIEEGHFGDHKPLGRDLVELRFFFGPGYRVYYTVKGNQVVLLISGGDKSTQQKDIKKAHKLVDAME